MTVFLACLISACFIIAFFILRKRLEIEGVEGADSVGIKTNFSEPTLSPLNVLSDIRFDDTQIMGRFTVSVFKPDGTLYKEAYIPDNTSYFSIGAAEDDNIIIPDERVSRGHILIGSDETGLFVRDNASTNGVRTKPSGPVVKDDIDITDNLELYLGPVKLRFCDTMAKSHSPSLVRRNKTLDTKTTI